MRPVLQVALAALIVGSCGSYEDQLMLAGGADQAVGGMAEPEMEPEAPMEVAASEAPPPPPSARPAKLASRARGKGKKELRDAEEADEDGEDGYAGEDKGGESSESVRQWFPESFLWQPLVQTDASGTASVDVRVPDQLTTWRVLGLAHDREGRQAGAVHTFDSALPLYVEPVVPSWLFAGDVLELPVQAVNLTSDPLDAALDVAATGALSGSGVASLRLAPRDSAVRVVRLEARGAGAGVVSARIRAGAERDAAERRVRVRPVGRPVERTRGGTLAGPRTFAMEGPAGADPATRSLQVLVFPGPLAVLQAELERLQGGVAPANGAYGFALASGLGALSERAGVDVDADAVRSLRVVAWQRIVKQARAPDAGVATDLLLALDDPGGHELAEELRTRLVRTVVQGQRADGTWARQSSAPLQQVIVQTALSARALPPDEEGARLRASGALERHARDVDDAYTASVVLASGVVHGAIADRMRAVLDEGLKAGSDGAVSVATPSGVRTAWGGTPSRAEALAFAALAVGPDDTVVRGDLASELMAGWDARWGFGAGMADGLALQAVIEALPGVPKPVEVVLSLAGAEVARGSVDPSQPHVPLVLEGRPSGPAEVELRTEPDAAGLAFVATLRSWVPWKGDEELPGVQVEVSAPGLAVGRERPLRLTIVAPSGVSVALEQGLPAGTAMEEAQVLAAAAGQLTSVEVTTDSVALRTRAFQAGEVMELALPVRPAYAGSFQTTPLLVSAGGQQIALPPLVWRVAPEGAGS